MKFIFGFLAGLLIGIVTLISTVCAFFAGFYVAKKVEEDKIVDKYRKMSVSPGHLKYRGMSKRDDTDKEEGTPIT